MEGVVGVMKLVAEHEARRVLTTEIGVVTAVFPHADEGDTDNYQCSVKLNGKYLPDGQQMELRRVPIAVPYVGMAAIPSIGDVVLVSFVGGDVNFPVVTGRLYDDQDRPPANQKDELLLQHHRKDGESLVPGGSLKLDRDGKVVITSANGENTLTVEDEKISIMNEKFSLTIDFKGEKITLSSDKDLEIVASSGKLSLTGNEVAIESKSDLKITASSGKFSVAANEAEVKGTSGVTLEGSAGLKLKGATLDLN